MKPNKNVLLWNETQEKEIIIRKYTGLKPVKCHTAEGIYLSIVNNTIIDEIYIKIEYILRKNWIGNWITKDKKLLKFIFWIINLEELFLEEDIEQVREKIRQKALNIFFKKPIIKAK